MFLNRDRSTNSTFFLVWRNKSKLKMGLSLHVKESMVYYGAEEWLQQSPDEGSFLSPSEKVGIAQIEARETGLEVD